MFLVIVYKPNKHHRWEREKIVQKALDVLEIITSKIAKCLPVIVFFKLNTVVFS